MNDDGFIDGITLKYSKDMQHASKESDERSASSSFDNVILLGAGSSYDAGIPLLCNFVDRMWEYAVEESRTGIYS
jgi:hypothetical protein